MKNSSSNLAIAWGCACILAVLFSDVQMPNWRNQTDFVSTIMPAAHLATSHQFTEMYSGAAVVNSAGSRTEYAAGARTEHAAGRFALARNTFAYPPLCAMLISPLAQMDVVTALLAWQGLSLLALAYCVFLLGKAASRIDAAALDSDNSGWYALMFFPTLIDLWSGNGDIIFGILPLTFGYYMAMTKKFLPAGICFALCLGKPVCLLPGFVTAFALLTHKRPKCMAGFLIGLAVTIGANAALSQTAFAAWLNSIKPALHLSFAVESSRSIQEYVANLPQAFLIMFPEAQQPQLASLAMLFAGFLLVLALHQIVQMQKGLKAEYQIVPLTFVTGLYLIPLVVPGANYSDLSIMVLAGLVVFSLEWRKFSDWRLKTTIRVTAIAINAFAVLVIFQPQFAYPLILIAILIIYFRRIIEAVHLAASEHGGVEQVFEDQEQFFD